MKMNSKVLGLLVILSGGALQAFSIADLPEKEKSILPTTFAHAYTVDLSNKGLTSLEGLDAVVGIEEAVELYLHNNNLTSIPEVAFSRMKKNLQVLTLNNNKLNKIGTTAFHGLNKLNTLILSRNELSTLPSNVFEGLISLKKLYLDQNNLPSLPDTIFHGLNELRFLYLNENKLTHLSANQFRGLPLSEIQLEYNLLPEDVIQNLRQALRPAWIRADYQRPLSPSPQEKVRAIQEKLPTLPFDHSSYKKLRSMLEDLESFLRKAQAEQKIRLVSYLQKVIAEARKKQLDIGRKLFADIQKTLRDTPLDYPGVTVQKRQSANWKFVGMKTTLEDLLLDSTSEQDIAQLNDLKAKVVYRMQRLEVNEIEGMLQSSSADFTTLTLGQARKLLKEFEISSLRLRTFLSNAEKTRNVDFIFYIKNVMSEIERRKKALAPSFNQLLKQEAEAHQEIKVR